MYCECSTCKYCYDPAGCVATTDLSIIRDAKVRMLVAKGQSYREQNWKVNEDICRQDVAAYKRKWSKRGVDIREWEHKVNECIKKRIRLLHTSVIKGIVSI